MNIKEIKLMINLMNENNLTELEIEQEGMRIRLKKGSGGEISVEDLRNQMTLLPTSGDKQTAGDKEEGAMKGRGEPKNAKTLEIKAPMVGTFYTAPSPESPPFIEINKEIEIGQVVCIIEAMKLMNEIKSEVKGRVVDILVDNAEPVEFGQSLFLIEPA